MLTFLRASRDEMRKTAWPSRHDTASQALLVLVAVLCLTAVIFAVDSAFADGLLRLLGIS